MLNYQRIATMTITNYIFPRFAFRAEEEFLAVTNCGSLDFLVRAADRTQKTLVVLSSIQRVINQSLDDEFPISDTFSHAYIPMFKQSG